jgi:hypothetical protein
MTSKIAVPLEGPSILHHQLWKEKDGRIEALALSPDGKTIVCGRHYRSTERWNTNGEMIGDSWTSGDHLANIYDMTEQSWFEIQKADKSKWQWSNSTPRTDNLPQIEHPHLEQSQLLLRPSKWGMVRAPVVLRKLARAAVLLAESAVGGNNDDVSRV